MFTRERSPDETRRLALLLGVAAMAVAWAVHIACGNRYGVFRDELYFLACGRHLAWGYVDQPPFIAVMARIASALFGTSPLGLRLLAFAAHGGTILTVAFLARRLGGGAFAALLSALAALCAPALLANGHLLTMNAFEPLFWTAVALAVLRATEGEQRSGWLTAGILVGVGLINKYSMAFWVAALAVGLLATRARRSLGSRWLAIAAALALLIVAPNVIWQAQHGFPMLELLRAGQAGKNTPFTWSGFFVETLLEQGPVAAPLWIAGLIWMLAGRGPGRPWLGLAFLVVAAEITLLHGKPYYLAPAFPVLFAGGACALERALRSPAPRVVATALLVAGGFAAMPLTLPLLSPAAFVAWQKRIGAKPSANEQLEQGPLPQHLADQLGWPEMVRSVAEAWRAVPEELKLHTVVFTRNYGEAGAIDLYGPALGLPAVYSGHNNYWLWGPPPDGTEAALVLGGTEGEYREAWSRVEYVGETPDSPWNMPYERRLPIWLLVGPKAPMRDLWAGVRYYR